MSVRPYRDIIRRKSRQVTVGNVLVGGDANVAYGRVVQVMTLLQQAGVPSVGMITDPPEN